MRKLLALFTLLVFVISFSSCAVPNDINENSSETQIPDSTDDILDDGENASETPIPIDIDDIPDEYTIIRK